MSRTVFVAFAAIVVCVVLLGAGPQAATQPQGKGLPKIEYKVEDCTDTPVETEKILNGHAKDGWQVVSSVYVNHSHSIRYVLSRPARN
jgi:hypothetical protein